MMSPIFEVFLVVEELRSLVSILLKNIIYIITLRCPLWEENRMKYQLYNHDRVQERYVTLTKENLGDELWDKLFEQLGETGADIYNNVELKVESAMFQNHNPIFSRVADLPNLVGCVSDAYRDI